MYLGIKLGAVDLGAEFSAIDPGAKPALQVGPFPFSLPSFPFPLFLSSLSPDASRRRRHSRHTSHAVVRPSWGPLHAGEAEMAGESPA